MANTFRQWLSRLPYASFWALLLALLFTVSTILLANLFHEKVLTGSSATKASVNEALPWLPMKVGTQSFYVQVVQTPEQETLGLSHRSSLPLNHGMLFPISPAEKVYFWMKDMQFPLDIIYIKDNKIVEIRRNVQPCSKLFCESFPSGVEVDYVLEILGKQAKKLGITVGDTVEPPTLT